jgi:hypothetical protein
MQGHADRAAGRAASQRRIAGALARCLLAALLAMGTARAERPATSVVGAFAHGGREVPVYRIEDVVSAVRERDLFAIDLAYRLRAFTAREGVEACARICRSPDGLRWGATLVTIKSRAACPRTRLCPADTEPTDVDIHSHLLVTSYSPSALDLAFLAHAPRPGQQVATRPELFSPGDFRTGPGYMVSRRVLQFQDGARDVRLVWRMGAGLPSSVPAAP